MKVGFVGLGAMGLPIAVRIRNAGLGVTGWDVSPSAREAAHERGVSVANGLAEVATDSEVVVTSLPDGAALAAVVGRPGSPTDCLAEGSPSGLVVIDTSSCAPDQTLQLGSAMAVFGGELFDAPVSGGVARAWKGDLTVMVGGDGSRIAAIRPVLETFGSVIVHTGALGTGHAMKALNNFISAATLTAACEALILGTRFGLNPATMVEVLNSSTARSDTTERKLPNHILTRLYDSGFALRLMAKDVGNVASLAASVGLQPALVERVRDIWQRAAVEMGPGADHTEIARWLEAALAVAADR